MEPNTNQSMAALVRIKLIMCSDAEHLNIDDETLEELKALPEDEFLAIAFGPMN